MLRAVAFWSRKAFSRAEVLAAADSARARGRRRKAIAGYRQVLAHDPADVAVHGKLAPLLAQAGRQSEALRSFRAAAEGQRKAGFLDKAVAVYLQASALLPYESTLWERIAALHVERQRRADAVTALVKGGRACAQGGQRADGVRLLRQAVELEPWHPDATFSLARLLARTGERQEAWALLEGLAGRLRGQGLRRVRAAQFWLRPTPAALWRWVRAVSRGR
jgi:Tfp pilus assembly protein PilF